MKQWFITYKAGGRLRRPGEALTARNTAVASEHHRKSSRTLKIGIFGGHEYSELYQMPVFRPDMQNFIAAKERTLALAPGLSSIVDAAEAAGWSVRREDSFVELVKPSGRPDAQIGYAV